MQKTIQVLLLTGASCFLIACGGGSSGGSGAQGNTGYPLDYPTAADSAEAGAGDDTDATAVLVQLGKDYRRTLFPARDIDWVKVELTAGNTYEFSVNRLCPTCDTKIELYDAAGGDPLATNDDTSLTDSSDSRIQYAITTDGSYFLRIAPYNYYQGLASYRLNIHVLNDADADGFSSFYDCNDNENTIYPTAPEIRDDGIDQDCTGADLIADTSADSFEDDDDKTTATPLPMLTLGHDEAVFIYQLHANDVHTLHANDDQDWFSIAMPAHSKTVVEYNYRTSTFNYEMAVYAADGTEVKAPLSTNNLLLENTSAEDTTYYLRIKVAISDNLGYYLPVGTFYGYDNDADGFYTMDEASDRDCNDNDASINPDATEINSDSIDSNCDGEDNSLPM